MQSDSARKLINFGFGPVGPPSVAGSTGPTLGVWPAKASAPVGHGDLHLRLGL